MPNVQAVNLSRISLPLLGCVVLLAPLTSAPVHAQTGRLSSAELSRQQRADEARGRRNVAHLTEAQRKKAYLEITYANRRAHKLIEEALATGKKKSGESGQWAYDVYWKPLFRKYRINADGWEAIESEGMDKDWPTPARWP